MMSVRIEPSCIAGPWRFQDGVWRCGVSVVRPYPHAAVESFAVETPDATLIVVRENPRKRGDGAWRRARAASGAVDCLDRLVLWPFNIQVLCLPRADGSVTVATGEQATAPLFLTAERGRLAADWDVAKLYPLIHGGPDFGRAAYILCHLALPYSRQTIFSSVQQLTERARARWDAASGALAVAYPEPAPRAAPRRLAPDADVHAAFETLFGAILARSLGDSRDPLATELSGGLDSGVATIIAARVLGAERVRSFGLLLPGRQRRAQAARRDAVASALNVVDRALPATAPFSRGDLMDVDPAIPWGEYYREAFLALATAIGGAGCTRLVRGIGGDEISELNWDEVEPAPDVPAEAPAPALPAYLTDTAREAVARVEDGIDRAPAGFAAESFYRSAAASAPVYLRRGIWPLYPYGTPEIVAFCQSLPKEWRADRALQRSYLARRGLAPSVVRPDPPESFLPLRDRIFAGRSAKHVRGLFEAPILAERGLVDAGRLSAAFERAVADPRAPGRTNLLEAATMETMLRTWRRAMLPMGP